jgi:hypothetical protein
LQVPIILAEFSFTRAYVSTLVRVICTVCMLTTPAAPICRLGQGGESEWVDTHMSEYSWQTRIGREFLWNSTTGRVKYPVMEEKEQGPRHTCPPAGLWAKDRYSNVTHN